MLRNADDLSKDHLRLLCYYKEILDASCFIKKRGLLTSQFWKLNVQNWGTLFVASGEDLVADYLLVGSTWERRGVMRQDKKT